MARPTILEKRFHAPPDRVFSTLADIPRAAQMISAIERIEMLTEGPVGPGTRWRETRRMFGRESTEEMEITEFVPGSHYRVEAESCGAHFQTTVRCVPDETGTRVSFTVETRPLTLFAKIMSPLGFLMAGSMKKAMEQDLEDVRNFLENQAPDTSPESPGRPP